MTFSISCYFLQFTRPNRITNTVYWKIERNIFFEAKHIEIYVYCNYPAGVINKSKVE